MSLSPTRLGRARERGSATVEFVLVLPLVLTVAVAILQLGLLVKDQLIVQESARAGARQASVSTDDATVIQAADDAAPSLEGAKLDVSVQRDPGAGAPVSVSVTYHAEVTLPIISWLFPSTVDLSSTAVMRGETG